MKTIQLAALISFHPFVYIIDVSIFFSSFSSFFLCCGSKCMSGMSAWKKKKLSCHNELRTASAIHYFVYFIFILQLLRISPVLLSFNFFLQQTVFFFLVLSSSFHHIFFGSLIDIHIIISILCAPRTVLCVAAVCKDKSDDDTGDEGKSSSSLLLYLFVQSCVLCVE